MSVILTVFLVAVCVLLAQASSLLAEFPVSYHKYGPWKLFMAFYNALVNPRVIKVIYYLLSLDKSKQLFGFLFLFRYIRLLVNIFGFLIYEPIHVPSNSTLTSKDTTVIIPTVDPFNIDFAECIFSVAATKPASIIIVTAGGYHNFKQASTYSNLLPLSNILVLSSAVSSVCTGQNRLSPFFTVIWVRDPGHGQKQACRLLNRISYFSVE